MARRRVRQGRVSGLRVGARAAAVRPARQHPCYLPGDLQLRGRCWPRLRQPLDVRHLARGPARHGRGGGAVLWLWPFGQSGTGWLYACQPGGNLPGRPVRWHCKRHGFSRHLHHAQRQYAHRRHHAGLGRRRHQLYVHRRYHHHQRHRAYNIHARERRRKASSPAPPAGAVTVDSTGDLTSTLRGHLGGQFRVRRGQGLQRGESTIQASRVASCRLSTGGAVTVDSTGDVTSDNARGIYALNTGAGAGEVSVTSGGSAIQAS